MSSQPSLKYAHIESEHRFLLAELPSPWLEEPVRRIHDRYISGTRLRLRTVQTAGEQPIWKLGQKIRLDPSSPVRVAHTTIYLDEGEASALAAMPGTEVVKMRRTRSVDGLLWAVDEFLGPLAGLVLAEVDLGEDGSKPTGVPLDVVADVSGDERFNGEALSRLAAEGLSSLVNTIRP